ncbi:MAG: SRPBCC family protein [Thermoplasmatota archaeon]
MPTLDQEVTIKAAPSKIYAVLSDFNSATSWVPGMKECKQTTPGPFGVGTKARQRKDMQGGPREVEVTVAKADPDRMTQLVAVPKGRPPATVTWTLTPQGGGAFTRVHEQISFEMKGFMALFIPMAKKAVAKEMAETTAALKRKVEG